MNNILNPDELTMTFKNNIRITHATGDVFSNIFNVFGFTGNQGAATHNWNNVSTQFKSVEFLSGSLTLYVMNCTSTFLNAGSGAIIVPNANNIFMVYKTARKYQSYTGTAHEEEFFTDPTTKKNSWEITAEQPGVSGKFVGGTYTGTTNVQKLKWKFNQKSWKNLKADRTGFQVALPLPANSNVYPLNSARVKLAFDPTDQSNDVFSGRVVIYASQNIKVRFKGKTTQ